MAFFRKPLAGADNLQLYLLQAVLPPMPHGSSAPLMPRDGHKGHRNLIAVVPEPYRARFSKIVAPKARGMFDKVVLEFISSLPSVALNQPNVDEATGIAFTIPACGFNIGQIALRHPSSIQEMAFWMMALPLQTMTRALHVAFPETREWDVTNADGEDVDVTFWNTLLWRKVPPPGDPERPWLNNVDPLKECKVVFVVQPPWILTPQDFKSFMRCSSLPPFNSREPHNNRPFTSAERVWAKLWDTCVRKDCHHWVISSYSGWVFGAFSQGYTAGQILDYKCHDASEPTIIGCLVYHVATSMGLVTTTKLPQYLETTWDLQWDMNIPPPSQLLDVEFADSGSEWDGMDDEPGISAGVSSAGSIAISAWGSECESWPSTARPNDPSSMRYSNSSTSRDPGAHEDVHAWQQSVDDEPPPRERELSPAPSETGCSTVRIYAAAERGGSWLPAVKVKPRSQSRVWGSFLATVAEQGPVDDSDS